MFIILGALLVIIGGILIWFNIPYSPVKSEFNRDIEQLITGNRLPDGGVFTEEDFSHLPDAVQKFVKNCGYIGVQKMSYMKMEFHNVTFIQGRDGPTLTIDYTQYNFINEPARMALIDSALFGIPFEGYDYYESGKGGMKGVVAKMFTMFDQTGVNIDKACLVTFLSESLFVPAVILQDYIVFEEIGEYEVKATISYGGVTVSGVFVFNEQYEVISFTTNDRAATGTDGTTEYIPWSALCGNYTVAENGIKRPLTIKVVWHYPDGDFIYFNGVISSAFYGV